jgi:hypothetical protein
MTVVKSAEHNTQKHTKDYLVLHKVKLDIFFIRLFQNDSKELTLSNKNLHYIGNTGTFGISHLVFLQMIIISNTDIHEKMRFAFSIQFFSPQKTIDNGVLWLFLNKRDKICQSPSLLLVLPFSAAFALSFADTHQVSKHSSFLIQESAHFLWP